MHKWSWGNSQNIFKSIFVNPHFTKKMQGFKHNTCLWTNTSQSWDLDEDDVYRIKSLKMSPTKNSDSSSLKKKHGENSRSQRIHSEFQFWLPFSVGTFVNFQGLPMVPPFNSGSLKKNGPRSYPPKPFVSLTAWRHCRICWCRWLKQQSKEIPEAPSINTVARGFEKLYVVLEDKENLDM